MSAILFSRAIGPVPIPVVVSEQPESGLEITEIPIEDGSKITDHAHSAPFKLALEIASGTLSLTYQALVAWQKQRVPFTYVSGFDVHNDLLIKRVSAERTSDFSTTFNGRIELQEVKIVSSASVAGEGGDRSGASTESSGGKREPGGRQSRRAAPPSASRASDAATKNRAAGTVNRGDVRTNPVPTAGGDVEAARGQSLLRQMGFGS